MSSPGTVRSVHPSYSQTDLQFDTQLAASSQPLDHSFPPQDLSRAPAASHTGKGPSQLLLIVPHMPGLCRYNPVVQSSVLVSSGLTSHRRRLTEKGQYAECASTSLSCIGLAAGSESQRSGT